MVQVVALATGFDNLCIRNEGEQFAVPESVARVGAGWFKPVDPDFKVVGKPVVVAPGDGVAALLAEVKRLQGLVDGKAKTPPVEGKKTKAKAAPDEPESDNTELV